MRVIAGTARGRPLRAPKKGPTRPTADLVKGALFSMLEAEAYKRGFEPDEAGTMAAALAWPRVVDLFAGSGALGIEALSRGARLAYFVEEDREAVETIKANLRATGLSARGTVLAQPVELAVGRVEGPVDAVFADPPYADLAALGRALDGLERRGLLQPTSVVALEQAVGSPRPERIGPLVLARTRVHGRTSLALYTGDAGPRASERARHAGSEEAGASP